MRSKTGMDEEEDGGVEEEEIDTGLAIADAIYAGLSEIARSIDRLAVAFAGDDEQPERIETYLDGTRIK